LLPVAVCIGQYLKSQDFHECCVKCIIHLNFHRKF
jgi:hypothetical protein